MFALAGKGEANSGLHTTRLARESQARCVYCKLRGTWVLISRGDTCRALETLAALQTLAILSALLLLSLSANVAVECRESAAAGLITNFESDLPSAFYAYLYRHSGLPGGHVVMLGDDQASRHAAHPALCWTPRAKMLLATPTLTTC